MKLTSTPEREITREESLLEQRLAAKIINSNQRSIEALIESGRSLFDAKTQLEQFWKQRNVFRWRLFLEKCRMSNSTASKLMTISNSAPICNAQNWPKLPLSSESLYELAHKLSDEKLQEMLDKEGLWDKTLKDIQDLIDGRQRDKAKKKNKRDRKHNSDDENDEQNSDDENDEQNSDDEQNPNDEQYEQNSDDENDANKHDRKSKPNSAQNPHSLELSLAAVPVQVSADGQELVNEFAEFVENVQLLVDRSSFCGTELLTNLSEVRKLFVPETANA